MSVKDENFPDPWSFKGYVAGIRQVDKASGLGFRFPRATRREPRNTPEKLREGGIYTVDGCEIHFAPPKKPWNDLIPQRKYQQTIVSHGFNVVQDFVHPQYGFMIRQIKTAVDKT